MQMKKKTKKILVGSAVATAGVAAVAAVYHAVTKNLVKVALDREQPKNVSPKAKKKVRGSEKLEELASMMEDASEKLRACELQDVQITADDGITLVGHLYTCQDAKRTIVAMHGWRTSWSKDFGLISPFWHENRCNVLYCEQRGQGESGGDYMGFGMLERYDCLAWINWLNENGFDHLPIYLGGVSMGASTVLMTTGFDLPANVRGVVADCGFTSAKDIWKHVVKNNMDLSYNKLRATLADDICKRKIQISSSDYSTIDAMKVCKVPILFLHGTEDKFVPVSMTYENYVACASEKWLVVFPGADHGMSYFSDKNLYETVVKNFWKDFDDMSKVKEVSEPEGNL